MEVIGHMHIKPLFFWLYIFLHLNTSFGCCCKQEITGDPVVVDDFILSCQESDEADPVIRFRDFATKHGFAIDEKSVRGVFDGTSSSVLGHARRVENTLDPKFPEQLTLHLYNDGKPDSKENYAIRLFYSGGPKWCLPYGQFQTGIMRHRDDVEITKSANGKWFDVSINGSLPGSKVILRYNVDKFPEVDVTLLDRVTFEASTVEH